ncbi:hypothetical protein PR202_gn00428 [Eleusine coracana subsp. coracana]|uniref:C2 domain-containing protein n=1 Tax=Eleusine coracana subsp. coracana TaxID=191504 RepID=A0AAV5G5B4_ELECO|nr:hypothetical protein PR202_gn00428 [Eleusine coracana subsp. coracana]
MKTAKTKVINSCLNPVWNEEMAFSVKEPAGIIRFEVFDWDRFKYDDKMGHAFLDLQPVAAATKLRRALRLTAGETKLRKVAPDDDNCLLSDSFVTYNGGEIVLGARLRLRDVESGELFITVKWIEADNGNFLRNGCCAPLASLSPATHASSARSNRAPLALRTHYPSLKAVPKDGNGHDFGRMPSGLLVLASGPHSSLDVAPGVASGPNQEPPVREPVWAGLYTSHCTRLSMLVVDMENGVMHHRMGDCLVRLKAGGSSSPSLGKAT